MSMYLSNTEIGPIGAEVAEFIDSPLTIEDLIADAPTPFRENAPGSLNLASNADLRGAMES